MHRGTTHVHFPLEVALQYLCYAGSLIRIPPDVEHYGEPCGDERVLNLDVFNPIRDDYRHLVEYQKEEFE